MKYLLKRTDQDEFAYFGGIEVEDGQPGVVWVDERADAVLFDTEDAAIMQARALIFAHVGQVQPEHQSGIEYEQWRDRSVFLSEQSVDFDVDVIEQEA